VSKPAAGVAAFEGRNIEGSSVLFYGGAERDRVLAGLRPHPHPWSAGTAREFVVYTLRASGTYGIAEDAVLLASELVAEALVHARRPLTITLVRDDHRLRVAVSDADGEAPARPDEDGFSDDGDRWWQSVNSLATV
jgi:hypothetical protein